MKQLGFLRAGREPREALHVLELLFAGGDGCVDLDKREIKVKGTKKEIIAMFRTRSCVCFPCLVLCPMSDDSD